jgi:hypothetical protein
MVRSDVVGQRSVQSEVVREASLGGQAGGEPGAGAGRAGVDPRMTQLGAAVRGLRAELDAYPAKLPDRAAAQDELDTLSSLAASGVAELNELRRSLLVTVAALGSVSALSGALAKVRGAVELLGEPGRVRQGS